MKPIDFPQKTRVLRKPDSMTDEECAPLPVFTDGEKVISCWVPTWSERLSMLIFGKVWLFVWSGESQAPCWLCCTRTVFNKK